MGLIMSRRLRKSDYYTVCLHALDVYLGRLDQGFNLALTRESVSETRQVLEAMRNNALLDEERELHQVEDFD
jgi:hypothetical protein